VATPPAVVVMAGAARARPELSELLGAERAAGVQRVLLQRAMEWGRALSAGRAIAAHDDESVADAVGRVFAGADRGDGAGGVAGGSAVVVVWPVLPAWRPEHSEAVLDDLAAGCQVSVAPVFDAGLYLLAMAQVVPAVLSLPEETWDSPDAIGLVLASVNQAGADVGLVRPERALRRPGDVEAALADPLLDAELRALLTG
jgi:glycosyltransferase A (GT-A) superfamily protein (DUF2064 family)